MWCHYMGIPAKIGDIPWFLYDFVSKHELWHPNLKLRYQFCRKLYFNIDSTPLPHPLTLTPLPHPLPPPFLPPSPCPFPQPLPSTILPPPPKVNRQLKIVNYFTCMRHFFCSWESHLEVDLNWYPRISNPYCWDIKIRKCEWSHGYKMTQSKLPIKYIELFYMYAALLL